MTRLTRLALGAALIALFLPGTQAGPTRAVAAGTSAYTIVDMGSLGGDQINLTAVNNRGVVVGYSTTHTPDGHIASIQAFVYNSAIDTKLRDISQFVGANSTAESINDNNTIVGDYAVDSLGFTNHIYAYRSSLRIFNSYGKQTDHVAHISNGGIITGRSNDAYNSAAYGTWHDTTGWHDFKSFFDPASEVSYAESANANGQIVGWHNNILAPHAILYDGSMHELGTLGGAYSYADFINEQGLIAGSSQISGSLSTYHAFSYDSLGDKKMHDLGEWTPTGLNNKGQMVGQVIASNGNGGMVVYYDGTTVHDLAGLLPANNPWTLSEVDGLNDKGQIIAIGQTAADTLPHALLISPTVPTLSIDDVTVNRPKSGTAKATFHVTLSDVSTKTVSVDYATKDGDGDDGAKSKVDYTTATGTLTFNPGDTTKTIDITIHANPKADTDRDFSVILSNPVNALLGTDTGTGTISHPCSIKKTASEVTQSSSIKPVSCGLVVNSIADGGDSKPGDGKCDTGVKLESGKKECTLRAAIQEANAQKGSRIKISFKIPGSAIPTIKPDSPLPPLTNTAGTIIDGASQAGTHLVEIYNTYPGDVAQRECLGGAGLEVQGGNSVIKGVVIGYYCQGILLDGGGNNVILGNRIGTDPTGQTAEPYYDGGYLPSDGKGAYAGIAIFNSAGNQIGGPEANAGNLISGNAIQGVYIGGASPKNVVQGNTIGPALGGDHRIHYTAQQTQTKGVIQSTGIRIGSPTATVGGPAPIAGRGPGNLIAMIDGAGVWVDPHGFNTVLQGNDFNANSRSIYLEGDHTTVGGTTRGAGNYIHDSNHGIQINSASNVIQGNFVGTDTGGNPGHGNTVSGILLGTRSAFGDTLGAVHDNLIGGKTTAAGNTIAFNGKSCAKAYDPQHCDTGGVVVQYWKGSVDDGPKNNTIQGNTIYSNNGIGVALLEGQSNLVRTNSMLGNSSLGIDLRGDGVTLDRSLLSVPGPNGLMPPPRILSATFAGGKTTIHADLGSRMSTHFTIEFFSSPYCNNNAIGLDGRPYGEGAKSLGTVDAKTGLSGNAPPITFTPKGISVPKGQVITSTATDDHNNTSEFSNCLPVT